MDDEQRAELLAELIERPDERGRLLERSELDANDRRELGGLVELADALWIAAHGAPPLQDDGVAAMLGLIPDSACRLDPAKLGRARKRIGLTVSELASRLQQRAWKFDHTDVFRWENRTAIDVPPAVIQTLSDILRTPLDRLISAPITDAPADDLIAVRTDARFTALVERWARAMRVPLAVATAALESRMLATVHRGERPDSTQMLESLDALVAAVERGGST